MRTVRLVSASGALSCFPVLIAIKLGIYEEMGLNVDVTGTDGGPSAAQAVASGEAEFGIGGLFRPLIYRNRGIADLSVVAQIMSRIGSYLVCREPFAFYGVEQSARPRILAPWGSPSTPAILRGLLNGKRSPVRGPLWVGGMDKQEAIQLYESGLGDGILLGAPTAQCVAGSGSRNFLYSPADAAGRLPYGVVYSTRQLAADHDLMVPFLRGLKRGREWLAMTSAVGSRPEVVDILRKHCPKDSMADYQAAIEGYSVAGMWEGHIGISDEEAKRMQTYLVEYGILDRGVTINEFYDGGSAVLA